VTVGLCASTAAASPSADKLVAGDVASRGPMLVAGKNGAAYDLRGGAKVVLSPDSEFAFEPSLHLKLRKPGDPDTLTRAIRVFHGRADVAVPAGLREPTAVLCHNSSKLSSVTKEGRSTFLSDDDHTTAAARSGEMLVGLGNEWKPLKDGLARTLAPEDPSAQPRPILAAPTVTSDTTLVVVPNDQQAQVSAHWSAMKDAANYEIVLTHARDALTPISRTATTDTTTTLGSLAPGAYDVAVVATDRYGLPGASSEPRHIRVVGVEAPAGALVASDGTVQLGRDQRIRLHGAEGLEVSYGSSQLFAAAPPALGLAHNAATLARLRAPGTKEEVALRLEPNGLRASIRIGPPEARWPVDQVAIQIDLYDANGRPLADDAAVEPSVTVNSETVAAQWERHGKTLRAVLPSGVAPGPWVVRAEVRDGRGELIGRDFLEVAQVAHRAGAVAHR
jgi:hypothetical protein